MNRTASYSVGIGAAALLVLALVAARLELRQSELSIRQAAVTAAFDQNRRIATVLRVRQQAAKSKSVVTSGGRVEQRTGKNPATAPGLDRGYQMNKLLREMPEYAPILRRETRRNTMRQWGDLFAQLNLSPERLERVKSILDDLWASSQDAALAANERGISNSDRAYQRMLYELRTQADRQLRDTLTPEEYDLYSRYQKIRSWQGSQLPEMEDYFAATGVPSLSAAQKQSLGDAYLETQKWKPEGPAVPSGMLFRLRNDQFAGKAGTALDPQQQAALVAYMKFVNAREDTTARAFFPDNPDQHVVTVSVARR